MRTYQKKDYEININIQINNIKEKITYRKCNYLLPDM